MKTEYIYKWSKNEDYNIPNNNYGEETESVVCEDPYDFRDWLEDNYCITSGEYEQDDDKYYLIDDEGNRTGEVYWIIDVITDSDKPLTWE